MNWQRLRQLCLGGERPDRRQRSSESRRLKRSGLIGVIKAARTWRAGAGGTQSGLMKSHRLLDARVVSISWGIAGNIMVTGYCASTDGNVFDLKQNKKLVRKLGS